MRFLQGALYQAHRKCTIRRNSFFFLPLTTKTGSKREAPKADSSTWLTPQLTVDLGGGYAARCLLFLRCTKRITRFPPQKNPMTHSIKCRHSALTTVNTGHTVAPRVTFPASQLSPDPASPHSDGRWPSQYPRLCCSENVPFLPVPGAHRPAPPIKGLLWDQRKHARRTSVCAGVSLFLAGSKTEQQPSETPSLKRT